MTDAVDRQGEVSSQESKFPTREEVEIGKLWLKVSEAMARDWYPGKSEPFVRNILDKSVSALRRPMYEELPAEKWTETERQVVEDVLTFLAHKDAILDDKPVVRMDTRTGEILDSKTGGKADVDDRKVEWISEVEQFKRVGMTTKLMWAAQAGERWRKAQEEIVRREARKIKKSELKEVQEPQRLGSEFLDEITTEATVQIPELVRPNIPVEFATNKGAKRKKLLAPLEELAWRMAHAVGVAMAIGALVQQQVMAKWDNFQNRLAVGNQEPRSGYMVGKANHERAKDLVGQEHRGAGVKEQFVKMQAPSEEYSEVKTQSVWEMGGVNFETQGGRILIQLDGWPVQYAGIYAIVDKQSQDAAFSLVANPEANSHAVVLTKTDTPSYLFMYMHSSDLELAGKFPGTQFKYSSGLNTGDLIIVGGSKFRVADVHLVSRDQINGARSHDQSGVVSFRLADLGIEPVEGRQTLLIEVGFGEPEIDPASSEKTWPVRMIVEAVPEDQYEPEDITDPVIMDLLETGRSINEYKPGWFGGGVGSYIRDSEWYKGFTNLTPEQKVELDYILEQMDVYTRRFANQNSQCVWSDALAGWILKLHGVKTRDVYKNEFFSPKELIPEEYKNVKGEVVVPGDLSSGLDMRVGEINIQTIDVGDSIISYHESGPFGKYGDIFKVVSVREENRKKILTIFGSNMQKDGKAYMFELEAELLPLLVGDQFAVVR